MNNNNRSLKLKKGDREIMGNNKKEQFMFNLNNDCFLVKGAKRGAIYDLKTGNVYSTNGMARDLIDLCEQNVQISKIADRLQISKEIVFSFLRSLEISNLGTFPTDNKKVQKVLLEAPEDKLDFIWLEITNNCNLRCQHCYSESSSKSNNSDKMESGNWLRIIKEAYELGCRRIQFIGGEPLLKYHLLYKLINFSLELGFESTEIFTNGTLLKDEIINFCSERKVAIAMSLYGPTCSIHDKITTKHGSFIKTLTALKKVQQKGISIRIAIVVMAQNENYLDETISFLKEIGITNARYDFVRPIGRGQGNNLTPQESVSKSPITEIRFNKCSLENFRRRKHGHNCFSKNICITPDGKVLPCIMSRKTIVGDVFNQTLQEIWNSQKAKVFKVLTKDLIDVCKACEYRYACFDCRPKAQGMTLDGNVFAKSSGCHYDPYVSICE